ncbi:MAG TPA: nickel pincer cofactor biosynthesis protein LarB [Polyangiales bacterium]|nr:nickel pincer cofactor biosynthesis protein LarB [Polyangiales bacterium]
MHKAALRSLLDAVSRGELGVEHALEQLRDLPFADLGFANVDHHRALRVGLPEVVFGLGKSAEHIAAIVQEIHRKGESALVTRVDPDKAALVLARVPGVHHDPVSRTLLLQSGEPQKRGRGTICVVSAGTSDLPVAAEAIVTARAFGNEVSELHDVGVAGLHRLLARREQLYAASVVIVIAGMEGALASVVGGLIDKPVIAVPTSIGYGASFGGVAALLSMLNSCASGVSVVNIDNGFGAAYSATLINQAGLPR